MLVGTGKQYLSYVIQTERDGRHNYIPHDIYAHVRLDDLELDFENVCKDRHFGGLVTNAANIFFVCAWI